MSAASKIIVAKYSWDVFPIKMKTERLLEKFESSSAPRSLRDAHDLSAWTRIGRVDSWEVRHREGVRKEK